MNKRTMQVTQYSAFPVLMIVIEDDQDETKTLHPVPITIKLLLWWLWEIVKGWRPRKVRNVAHQSWERVRLSRIGLEFRMGTILSRNLALAVMGI